MTFHKKLIISKDNFDLYKKYFDYGKDEFARFDIPQNCNLTTWSVKFDNGFEIDIKINSSEDDIWSEGVLFDEEGRTLATSEVCYALDGRWSFEFEGNNYIVDVVKSSTTRCLFSDVEETFVDETFGDGDGIWVGSVHGAQYSLELYSFKTKREAFDWMVNHIKMNGGVVDEMCKDTWKESYGDIEWQVRFMRFPPCNHIRNMV